MAATGPNEIDPSSAEGEAPEGLHTEVRRTRTNVADPGFARFDDTRLSALDGTQSRGISAQHVNLLVNRSAITTGTTGQVADFGQLNQGISGNSGAVILAVNSRIQSGPALANASSTGPTSEGLSLANGAVATLVHSLLSGGAGPTSRAAVTALSAKLTAVN